MYRRILYFLTVAMLVFSLPITSAAIQPLRTKAAPIPIGAQRAAGVHEVAPRQDIVIRDLQSKGLLPMKPTAEQTKAVMAKYYQRFFKKSDTWVNPQAKERALAAESQPVSNSKMPSAGPVAVTVSIFALAVDFGNPSETLTIDNILFDDYGDPYCPTLTPTASATFNGPLQGAVPAPDITPVQDNNTLWYTPAQTADPSFYSNLIFGYQGVGRVRMDLKDPLDGQAGINLVGYTVQDYYDHIAGKGNVNLEGTVEGWVTVNHSEGYYGADTCGGSHGGGAVDPTTGDRVPVAQLVTDSVDQFQAAHPSYYTDTSANAYWKQFDKDEDGILDTFWIIHAGAGQEAGGGAEGDNSIWSHSSDLRYYSAWYPDGYKVYEGNPAVTTDDIYIGPYTMQPEMADLGVFAEEFGHNFFGFPDMYTTDVQGSIGFWNIMEAGSWGGYLGGSVPTGMPLWFRLIAWCGSASCNWADYTTVNRIAYNAATADYTIRQLEHDSTRDASSSLSQGIRIDLPAFSEVVPNVLSTGPGDKAIYSGTGRDDVDITLDRSIAIGTATTLSFDADWQIEDDYDYGYVEVSTDSGVSWTPLKDTSGFMTTSNPNGSNLGVGLTGSGSGNMKFNVSAYQGTTIVLRLEYITDSNTNYYGWTIDNVKLDSTSIDDFTSAVASPVSIPGWTNSTTDGWRVVPTVDSYTNYYLVEWRNNTKYDGMAKTAYITTDSDTNLWRVERVPYNVPGALVYYRNAKYSSSYSQLPNYNDGPSFGPKYQLLLVDMNYGPMRRGTTSGYFNARVSSYDSALTLQPSAAFSISKAYGYSGGPWTYASEPAVTNFNDTNGYYAGVYAYDGVHCYPPDAWSPNYYCSMNRDGSAAIPARGSYSMRVTTFYGTPDYALYGKEINFEDLVLAGGWAWADYGYGSGPLVSTLGSGNPGSDNVQYGVNIDLLSQAADGTSGTLRVRNYSVDMILESAAVNLTTPGHPTITYTGHVQNLGKDATKNVKLTFTLDSNTLFTAMTCPVTGSNTPQKTPDGMVKICDFGSLAAAGDLGGGDTAAFTLTVAVQNLATSSVIRVDGADGQVNNRGPWWITAKHDNYYKTYWPIVGLP